MITDDTIDTSTAKFWCMFGGDKEFLDMASKAQKKQLDENGLINQFIVGSSVLFTGMSLFNLVAPYIKNAWNKFTTRDKDILAKVKFTADGKGYDCSFDMNKMKWRMFSDSSVTNEEIMMFFQTQFFQAFNARCREIFSKIFSQKEEIMKNLSKIKDSKSQEFLKKLMNSQRQIQMNMFAGKYMT